MARVPQVLQASNGAKADGQRVGGVDARFLLLAAVLHPSACAEPAIRDVESVSVVVSVQTSELATERPTAAHSSAVPIDSAVPTTSAAPPDLDELKRQELVRALEKARIDAKKPNAPGRASSNPACAASDPLCD